LNHKIADITSQKIQNDFASLVEKLNLMGNTMIQQFPQKLLFTDLFFTNDRNMIYVGIGTRMGAIIRYDNVIYSHSYFYENRLNDAAINRINGIYAAPFARVFNNEALVQNVSKSFQAPVMALALPFQKAPDGSVISILVCYMKLDRFLQAFQTRDIFETFMVNNQGDIIAHPDGKIVLSHGNYLNLPIVEEMIKSKLDNGQKRYQDADGVYRLGSFKKIGFGGLGVIATVSEDKAFESVYQIQRRNILIMIIVLNLAILIVYFFSKTITNPITRLLGATKEIENGNFRVDIVPSSGDEIGELTTSFVAMGRGLEEREKLKETFGKFVNKEIAEQVLKGEIKLGGERKIATVFFSDIRQFTAISEKLEPEEVVEFLNQYMTRMVNCVNVTRGVVDKYIGDAIMAVWGTPISYGNDAENSVNGALMMRNELMGFNRGRGDEKKPVINIGCGINTGPVLAGQIGSEERMEYTVIGDTVNVASRIESLTKELGATVLVSQATVDRLGDGVALVERGEMPVKGRERPIRLWALGDGPG
jgi:adenylate cyclase